MDINILKAALEYYVQSADCCNEDRQKAFAALTSCSQAIERFAPNDIRDNIVYITSIDAMAELLNMTTYDWFGRRQKAYGSEQLPFNHYVSECRRFIPDLTNEQLELGYDIVSDLWHENELTGSNNEDGTYRHA